MFLNFLKISSGFSTSHYILIPTSYISSAQSPSVAFWTEIIIFKILLKYRQKYYVIPFSLWMPISIFPLDFPYKIFHPNVKDFYAEKPSIAHPLKTLNFNFLNLKFLWVKILLATQIFLLDSVIINYIFIRFSIK